MGKKKSNTCNEVLFAIGASIGLAAAALGVAYEIHVNVEYSFIKPKDENISIMVDSNWCGQMKDYDRAMGCYAALKRVMDTETPFEMPFCEGASHTLTEPGASYDGPLNKGEKVHIVASGRDVCATATTENSRLSVLIRDCGGIKFSDTGTKNMHVEANIGDGGHE